MAATEARMGIPAPYSATPGSPTLTNPDMILPEYEPSSSSLDDGDDQEPSPAALMMWQNAHAATSGANLQQLFPVQQIQSYASAPIPTTPIIYGNGTMLSDIGEVTEVESTPGRPSPGSARRRATSTSTTTTSSSFSRAVSPTPPHHLRHQYDYNTLNDMTGTPRRSSPTMGEDDVGKGSATGRVRQQHQQPHQVAQERLRRDSTGSNSTITTQDRTGLFADFDDSVSVGDSVFQGDDEDSVADSYVNEGYASRGLHGGTGAILPSYLGVPDLSGGLSSGYTSDEGDRRHSAASISRRAEQILANAKRRLTTMEDNLTRARSSLYITSPTSGSIPSDGSTPSPRIPTRSVTAFADSRIYDSVPYSPGHARLTSDSFMPGPNLKSTKTSLQRSASAMGAAGGYRQPSNVGARSVEQIRESLRGGYYRQGYSKPSDITLESLAEDNAFVEPTTSAPPIRNSAQLENFLTPTFGSFNNSYGLGLSQSQDQSRESSRDPGLTRSTSVTQMRDLKDQMKDLKGKISSLRDQARADSMKRRSLQSLRTPDPFTHSRVDQWYAEPQDSSDSTNYDNTGRNPWNGELSSVEGDQPDDGHIADDTRNVTTPTPISAGAGTSALSALGLVAAVGTAGATGAYMTGASRHTQAAATSEKEYFDEEAVVDAYEEMSDDTTRLKIPGAYQFDDSSVDLTLDDDADDDLQTENGDAEEEDEEEEVTTPRLKDSHRFQRQQQPKSAVIFDDAEERVIDGHLSRNQEHGYESESGDSLYHDSVQQQISHEDREDAFDYENFILHSALGTISQQRISRDRRDSFSSEDSVETTRGPIMEGAHGETPVTPKIRRGSASSISTMESFATATEGRTSRAEHEYDNYGADDEDHDEFDDNIGAHNYQEHQRDSIMMAKGVSITTLAAGSIATTTNISPPSAKRNSVEEPRQTKLPSIACRPASSAAVPGHRPSTSSFESTGTNRSFPLINRNKLGSSGSGSGSNSNSIKSSPSIAGGLHHSSRSSSDNEELKSISETIMHETASACKREQHVFGVTRSGSPISRVRASLNNQQSHSSLRDENSKFAGAIRSRPNSQADAEARALQMLTKEDQVLVERLVGNLGRCVLCLSENSGASTESRNIRRRVDAARRILEGLEPV